MSRQVFAIVWLALMLASSCLADAGAASEDMPGLRGAPQKPAHADSLPTAESSAWTMVGSQGLELLPIRADSDRLRAAFHSADSNSDGFLSLTEFLALVNAGFDKIGLFVTMPAIEPTFNKIDTNGDGKLSIDEFIVAMGPPTPQQVMEAFKAFDGNSDGFISMEEMLFEFGKFGITLKDRSKFDVAFHEADSNGDGKLSFDEFEAARLLRRGD